MNSMPEPTNDSDRINDNADFRDGYAEGFLDAVAAKKTVDAETAAAVESLAARRDELTDAERDGIRDAIASATVPDGAAREDCPEWCTFDHREDDERDDLILHMGDEHTDGTVRKLLDVWPDAGTKLDVRVARTDCPSEGTVGAPTLLVRCDVELSTWEQAAELARTILDGFGYLAGADKA